MTPSQRRALEALLADPTKKALLQEAQKRGYQLDVAALDRHDVRPGPLSGSPEEEARNDLLAFMAYIYPHYTLLPFHRLLAHTLARVESGEIKRLIIMAPPRHGKSLATSILFPIWYLGRNPDHRIISSAFSSEFIEKKISLPARGFFRSPEYQRVFPDVQLSPESRSISDWDLDAPHRGGYAARGIGAPPTGMGANLLLVDDPVADDKEARSKTALEGIWDWFTVTAYTRLAKGGAIVIIMTRWAEDDLAGRAIRAAQDDPNADHWHVLRIPAIAEENDPLDRPVGEPLWPDNFGIKQLAAIRATLRPWWFESLYQQNPLPAEGNIFKSAWWAEYDPQLTQHTTYRAIECHYDTAVKKGKENDYTACWVGGLTWDNKIHVLEVWWEKYDFPQLVARIKSDYQRLSAMGRRPSSLCVEDKASGSSVVQALIEGTGLPVRAILPEGDKVARAHAVTAYYENAQVLHPKGAHWLADYYIQMERFPAGKHDDVVDASTQGVSSLFKQVLAANVGIPAAGGTRPTFVVPHSPVAASPLFAAGGRSQDYLIGARTPYR